MEGSCTKWLGEDISHLSAGADVVEDHVLVLNRLPEECDSSSDMLHSLGGSIVVGKVSITADLLSQKMTVGSVRPLA